MKQKIPVPRSLTEGHLQPQAETLEREPSNRRLQIGIPKADQRQENRVALVPAAVSTLVARGHTVLLEAGAGEQANYGDIRYSEAGARVSYDRSEVFQSQVLLKVSPPTLEEAALYHPGQVIITPLTLPMVSRELIEKLQEKRVVAFAMEYIQDDNGSFPFVRVMSEMAGLNAVLTAAELLSVSGGGKGVLLGGVAGVPSAKIVILGAGVVGESATRVALGLGAEVRVFDNDVYKLMRLQRHIGQRLNTSTLNPFQLEKDLLNADVVIGAIHAKTGRTPVVVPESMVEQMKPGSVIIDVSIDQGGCFETSELTSHAQPTFLKHGVIHYCVPNMASKVPRTASIAMSNILTPWLLSAGEVGGVTELLYDHAGLRNGVFVFKGLLTNAYLGRRFDLKHTDLDLLIASRL